MMWNSSPLSDVQHEIYIPRENTGQVHDCAIGYAGIGRSQEQ